MLGQPKTLSDVIDHFPECAGYPAYFVVSYPYGAVSGFITSREQAYAMARERWPTLTDDEHH